MDKQAYTANETIDELLKTLRFYADRNRDASQDIDGDGEFACDGARAREVIDKFGLVKEMMMPVRTEIVAGDVRIIQTTNGRRSDVTTFEIDGVQQHGVQSLKFEASISEWPTLTFERLLGLPKQ